MRIGISINGIVRDLLGKIKVVHEKYYESSVEDELSTDNLKEVLGFESDDDLIQFMYREAPMEIFGHAKEVQNNFIRNLNELINYNKDFSFTLISDEVGRGISATFWFLAKYGCTVKNIKFYTIDKVDRLWEDFDLIISNDDPIINSKPDNKILYILKESPGVDSKTILDSPDKIIELDIFKNENVEQQS